ncbi:hypothetical protein MASR2M17_03080 [Aminivibrio sp.]
MIGGYEVPEIQALWSEESKFRTWLEVELAVCGVWKERGSFHPCLRGYPLPGPPSISGGLTR